ncbi:hypothetical protein ACE1TF_05720 [Geomicrobium sp. JSM 1781026]|uniref:hypothetical protein n=1 Tax=Geomicrobium sp. JSM 1781026 TaxID=3344580 RepID=UPI0035C0F650
MNKKRILSLAFATTLIVGVTGTAFGLSQDHNQDSTVPLDAPEPPIPNDEGIHLYGTEGDLKDDHIYSD